MIRKITPFMLKMCMSAHTQSLNALNTWQWDCNSPSVSAGGVQRDFAWTTYLCIAHAACVAKALTFMCVRKRTKFTCNFVIVIYQLLAIMSGVVTQSIFSNLGTFLIYLPITLFAAPPLPFNQ